MFCFRIISVSCMVRSESLTCTFRANLCSARLSRTQVLTAHLSGIGFMYGEFQLKTNESQTDQCLLSVCISSVSYIKTSTYYSVKPPPSDLSNRLESSDDQCHTEQLATQIHFQYSWVIINKLLYSINFQFLIKNGYINSEK